MNRKLLEIFWIGAGMNPIHQCLFNETNILEIIDRIRITISRTALPYAATRSDSRSEVPRRRLEQGAADIETSVNTVSMILI